MADQLTASIDGLDKEVDRLIRPFAEQHRRLTTIPGIGKRTAEVIIAEIGVDMSRFPTAAHLASRAGMCPGNHESAGKRRTGKARKGDGHAMLVIVWHLLHDERDYEDLGADFLAKRNDAEARKRYLIRQLEALGQTVTVTPAA